MAALEHLGKTTLFGQYYHNNGGSQDRTVIRSLRVRLE